VRGDGEGRREQPRLQSRKRAAVLARERSSRVGVKCIHTPYLYHIFGDLPAIYLVISLPKIPCICIWFWPTLATNASMLVGARTELHHALRYFKGEWSTI
jgi:hypothetical protein